MSKGILTFDPEKHEYKLNGEVIPGTTDLMKKHGLSVDYDEVPDDIMANARLFGDVQHLWLDKYFKGQATIDEVNNLAKQAIELLDSNGIIPIVGEERVHNGRYAGTIDLLAMKGDKNIIVDYKYTYNYNVYSIQWQQNIYKRLVKYSHDLEIHELWCLWFNKQKGEHELRLVADLSDELVEELFRADENGEIFKSNQNEIMSTIDRELAVDRELLKLFEAQKYVKSIETNVELLKEQLLIEMENNGIRTYETDNYAITRVQESVGVKYDNARLYSDFRTMGGDTDEYKIATTRKAHLRITDKRPKGV